MDEGEKKEGKSSGERQAAKKPAYQPTLVYRSEGRGVDGTAAAGTRESKAHTEQGKAKAVAVQGSRMLTGRGCYRGVSAEMCLRSEQPPG